MHRMNIAALTVTIALGVLTGVFGQASAQGVTAYEGARVIVGDGRVLTTAWVAMLLPRARSVFDYDLLSESVGERRSNAF